MTDALGRWMRTMAVGAVVVIGAMAGLAHTATAQTNTEGTACATPGKSEWTIQEHWVWERLCSHETTDLSIFAGPSDPDLPDTWTPDHILRPEFLETVLLDRPYITELADRRVSIRGAWFESVIDLSDAHIDGALFLRGSRFDGPLRLISAQVDGRFSASESTFNDELVLNGATVAGSVFLRDGNYQRVDLVSANIGGTVITDSSTFNDELDLNSATVAGSVFLRDGNYQGVDLGSANISGTVITDSSTFNATVSLNGATIEGDLRLSLPDTEPVKWGRESVLDLRAARVRGIDDTQEAWPPTLQLTGFTYRLPIASGTDSFINRPTNWYLSWLDRQPTFSRQPYKQLEAALRDVGRGGNADDIAIARRDRELEPGELLRYAGAQLHRATVGYGFRPELSLYWIGGLWLLGVLIAARIPLDYRVDNGVTSRGLFSFDRLIPLVTLRKADHDLDLTNEAVPSWVRRYFYFQTIAGYVLAAFLVTTIGRIAA